MHWIWFFISTKFWVIDVAKTKATSNKSVFSRALGWVWGLWHQDWWNLQVCKLASICQRSAVNKTWFFLIILVCQQAPWKVGFLLERNNLIWWCHFFLQGSLYSNISSSSYDLFLTSATGDGVKLWDLRSPRYVVAFASRSYYDRFNKSGVIGCNFSLEQGMWLMCQTAHHSILANGRIYFI